MIGSPKIKNRSFIQPTTTAENTDLICFSPVRWDFFDQRPHQVMRRFAKERRVFYVEEPLYGDGAKRLSIRTAEPRVWAVMPHLPRNLDFPGVAIALEQMMNDLMETYQIARPILWYYTPLALAYTHHLRPFITVYDCINELSLFKGESALIYEWEAQLFQRADLVFNSRTTAGELRSIPLPPVQLFPLAAEIAAAGAPAKAGARSISGWTG